MTEIKKKGGVVISKEGQHLRITVPSFSTVNIVYPEDKSHFIKYLKYIYNKWKKDKSFCIDEKTIKYGEDTIYIGSFFSVKYPKFGNFLEINKIPIILNLLNCDEFEYCSVISIIKKIKKIRGGK